MQFAQTETYQPASLRLIKEALKMEPPKKNLHAGSRAQSEGKGFALIKEGKLSEMMGDQ